MIIHNDQCCVHTHIPSSYLSCILAENTKKTCLNTQKFRFGNTLPRPVDKNNYHHNNDNYDKENANISCFIPLCVYKEISKRLFTKRLLLKRMITILAKHVVCRCTVEIHLELFRGENTLLIAILSMMMMIKKEQDLLD